MKSLLVTLLLLGATVLSKAATAPRFLQNFDFEWRFQLGDSQKSSAPEFDDASWRKLDVPHDFGVEGDFSETYASCTGYLPGGIAWYRKTFVAPADWKNNLVSVEFDGVAMNSEVWINGHYLGKRPYAYSTFNYDLTPFLNLGGTNIIAVRVDHTEIADSRWYMGSGIYRNVWLVGTEKIHVARHGVYVTTPEVSAASAQVAIQTRVQNQTDAATEVELLTEIINANGKVVKSVTSKATIPAQGENLFSQDAEVASPKLWSPDAPNLYKAVTTIRMANKNVDREETTFGIRSIRFDAQLGFLLNGQPEKFKGICIHHDAGAVGAAVPEEMLERRLLLTKAIGCNAIRTSHNPMAPEFYDLCDRLGLLVMDEAFDEWTGAKHKWVTGWNAGVPALHGYSEFFEQWADADLTEMIQRDRNHPCVILWSIGNEVDYPNDPFSYPTDSNYDAKKPSAEILAKTAPRLIKVVRENDPTRPVTAALANVPASNATGLADLLDVDGYNYQAPQYAKDFAQYPNRKIVGSEDTSAMDLYELAQNPRVAGQFLWVGFDFLGEAPAWPSRGSSSGLFDTCGFLKTRSFQRAALWSEKPVVYLAVRSARDVQRGGRNFSNLAGSWNWQDVPRAELPVSVFSNCKSVELFLNGKSLGRKADGTNDVFQWNVPFSAGELKAVGTLDGKKAETSLVTAGKPARLELIPDRTRLAANGQDAANVELRLVDAKGNLVPNGDALCSVQVTGAGRLVGLDNGDQRDMTSLQSPARKLNQGRALAIVESSRQTGAIELTVTAPGLPVARLQLRAK
jgi:beta-galactosidase